MIKVFYFFLLISCSAVYGVSFDYPKKVGDKLLGSGIEVAQYATAKQQDTLLDIARDYDLGQNEILLANPNVDRWLPGEGTSVKIPNARLLPEVPHEGLVLNLPEFRLYFFPEPEINQPRKVMTHPVSIGRVDWDTPLGKTWITAKTRNPVWRPPQSIKDEHAAKGEILPDVVPAGADNPLGLFALRLAVPGYLIHSTNKPYGVGMRVSHGCVRMYPEDIEKLFPLVKKGLPVYIINQPIKVGWSGNYLYIEVYPDLEGNERSYSEKLNAAFDLIEQENGGFLPVIDGLRLKYALQASNGIPVAIFVRSVESDE